MAARLASGQTEIVECDVRTWWLCYGAQRAAINALGYDRRCSKITAVYAANSVCGSTGQTGGWRCKKMADSG